MNFCTHCDKNYFYKGVALWKSLTEQCSNGFVLHWLCNDEDTFRQLSYLKLPNVIPYALSDLEKNEDLFRAKRNPPSKFGDQYSQYCWTLTPYFSNYILKALPEGEKLMYCDSDIFFYRSPKIILDIVGDKVVGIHTHRFSRSYTDTITGWYNVGVMVFTNNDKGREVSDKWKGWLLNTNHEYYDKYGTCGDQKYLDLFPQLWPDDVSVFDDERCSHLAPWNCDVKHLEDKHISHNNTSSPVVFFHFSHFNIDMPSGNWRDSNNGEWHPTRNPSIKEYYQQYSNTIKSIHSEFLK